MAIEEIPTSKRRGSVIGRCRRRRPSAVRRDRTGVPGRSLVSGLARRRAPWRFTLNRGVPTGTVSPSAARTSVMVPACEEVNSKTLFVASKAATAAPGRTVSPGRTSSSATRTVSSEGPDPMASM